MKFLIVAAAILATTLAYKEEYLSLQFAKFKADHGKTYHTKSEETRRFQIFAENMKMVETHNKAGLSYKFGINQFSDMTQEEFKAQSLGGYKRLPQPEGAAKKSVKVNAQDLPESVDWRDSGAVSAVKNQGSCGSCWAFATTEMIESYAAIASDFDMVELSSQQVTSCTPNTLACGGTGGCMGSIPQLGYTYIQLFGHATEDSYPYQSGDTFETGDCLYDVTNTAPVVGITGYDTMSNDQDATMFHLANIGPLAVAVDASNWSFYSGGVFDGCSFSDNIGLNHAVQMVGYGTDAAEGDFWIVRNSWGSRWGEDGYIRLKRQATAECGTNSTPMDGTACVGGPGNDEQHVCGQCGVLYDVSYPLGAHTTA